MGKGGLRRGTTGRAEETEQGAPARCEEGWGEREEPAGKEGGIRTRGIRQGTHDEKGG